MNAICPRCKTIVYHAEKMTGPGGAWHKGCLTCKECNKRLDSTNLTEREGEAYCKTCYNRAWGPKGYGYAGGASFLTTDTKIPFEIAAGNSFSPTSPRFPVSSQTGVEEQQLTSTSDNEVTESEWNAEPTPVQPQPRRWSRGMPFGGATLAMGRPIPLEARVDSPRPTTPPSDSPKISRPAYATYTSGSGYVPKKLPFKIQSDTCRGCGKPVYAAEAVMGAGHKYHKLCLKCTNCNRLVDATIMVDRESKVYCRACYAKEFGPKGYGYAGGAAFLSTGEYANP